MKTFFRQRVRLSGRTFLVASTLLFVPVVATVVATPTMARTPSTNYGQKAGQIADAFTSALQSLNLSDAQKTELKAIAQKYAPQARSIMADKSLSQTQKKTQLSALHVSAEAEVNAALTPKQEAQLKALKAATKQQVMALLAQISAELKLTPDQVANLKSILQNARSEGMSLAFKPGPESAQGHVWQQRRAALAPLRTKVRGQVETVLTPEQTSKLAAIMNQIRPELLKRANKWRSNGGLGLGLIQTL